MLTTLAGKHMLGAWQNERTPTPSHCQSSGPGWEGAQGPQSSLPSSVGTLPGRRPLRGGPRPKVRVPSLPRHPAKRRQPVTICAAAICKTATSQGVIGISDRMLTMRGETEFESGATKVFSFHPANVICLSAGEATASLEIARNTRRQVEATGITDVAGVARLFAENHAALRQRRLADCLLGPLGLNFATFLSGQHGLPPALLLSLAEQIQDQSWDLGAEAVIAGVDGTGAHVYHVSDPGQSRCFDGPGFVAIGLGARHFETVFMAHSYDPTRDYSDALLLTFSAKRQAEMAPGVGRATDIIIMGEKEPYVLLQNEVEAIGSCHDDFTRHTARAREMALYAVPRTMFLQPVRQSGPVAPAGPLDPPRPEGPADGSAI
jgi:hypothetical protein